MKRLQLSKNKLARLAINIGFIVAWFFLSGPIIVPHVWYPILWTFNKFANPYDQLPVLISQLIIYLPIVLGSRYIWTGRIKPRPRITRSKED
tara:strand:- start:187 stop:462 length:276 start_codon:yes stop_codon:yes gene_type:complete